MVEHRRAHHHIDTLILYRSTGNIGTYCQSLGDSGPETLCAGPMLCRDIRNDMLQARDRDTNLYLLRGQARRIRSQGVQSERRGDGGCAENRQETGPAHRSKGLHDSGYGLLQHRPYSHSFLDGLHHVCLIGLMQIVVKRQTQQAIADVFGNRTVTCFPSIPSAHV